MKEFLDLVARVVPPLKLYPDWVQLLVCVWLVFSASVVAVLIFKYDPKPKNSSGPSTVGQPTSQASHTLPPLSQLWPNTGDERIDEVLAQLNRLEERGTATEAEISSVLRRFFQRPVFSHIQEESPDNAAYTFCYGELLLDHYQPFYDQNKEVSEAIGRAKTRLIKLQQILSLASGNDRFFVQRTFTQFANNRVQFIGTVNMGRYSIELADMREANDTLVELMSALDKISR